MYGEQHVMQDNIETEILISSTSPRPRRHMYPKTMNKIYDLLLKIIINPLTGTLKPQSNRSLCSNTAIGTLAVSGHHYSPRMVEEIKEEKMEHQTNKQ